MASNSRRPKDQAALEAYARALRDNIYGPNPKHCTTEGWENVKHNWCRPDALEWLEDQPQNKAALP